MQKRLLQLSSKYFNYKLGNVVCLTIKIFLGICWLSFTYFSALDSAIKAKGLKDILILGIEITHEIVAEILCSHHEVLGEIAMHDKAHKVILLKKIVFSFVTI